MKTLLMTALIVSLTSQIAFAGGAPFHAYKVRFGKADGRGTSGRTVEEKAGIESARVKIADALKDRVLETAHLRYTNEGDLMICIESATYGYGIAARNAQKTAEIFDALVKLKPEVAEEVGSCFAN